VIARETAETLAEHEPPVLAARIGQRVAFVDAAQSGRLVFETDEAHPATRKIDAFAIETATGAVTERSRRRSFTARPSDAESWVRTPEPPINHATTAEFIARLTIDVTPALRGRIKTAVADMLRALLDREFPDKGGAAS